MKILTTGGTGFIGSHLLPRLIEKGFDVYNVERYVTGRYAEYKKHKTVFADLREYHALRKVIREVQPEVVIHLASISPVSYSYENFVEVTETNLMGTINLAETCLREVPHFKHFLFASTSETYGICPQIRKTESSPQIPNSPYAVSKLACEHYLTYMNKAYGFPVAILRPFNTYGRKKDYHFIVEKTIVQMLKYPKGACLLGDPTPTRDFLYIDDHVNAYLTCLEKPNKTVGETFNFCTGVETSIEDLVEKIAELTGFKGEIHWGTVPSRPLDIQRLVGSYDKAKQTLGWEPKFSLEEGLKHTIDFWRNKI